MSADRHTRLTEVFLEASELPLSEREAFLDGIFAQDTSLRAEVEAMLAFEVAEPKFMEERPQLEQAAEGETAAGRVLERLQKRIGKESRYEILGEFARGGMGVILKVWDHDLRRTLAMKVVLGRGDMPDRVGTSAVSEKSLGRFLEEAQVTGQLDHPGIVPVHELGMDSEGQVYFTMRLVKGIELGKVFERVRGGQDGWTHSRAVGTILKVCEAMAFAHSKGVIHRDLKPANIMVGKYGEVYVMDWGVARSKEVEDKKDLRIRPARSESFTAVHTDRREEVDDDSPLLTMDGDVMGTPAYMSPEQARGDQAAMGPHSDVYALGAILYHLLAGHRPYSPADSRLSAYAIWALVQNGPPAKLETIAKDVPVELVAICEKAMARDIAHRYPDMGAMAEDLQAYVEGRVVRAHRTGAVVELKKWVVRNRGLAASLAAAVVLALGGLGSVGYVQAKGRTAEERQRKLAESETAKVLRLSDVKLLEQLEADAGGLWPVHPENIPALEAWLERAEELVATLAGHRADLEEMQAIALPWSDEDRARDRAEAEAELATLHSELDQAMALLENTADEVELIEAEQRLGVLEPELEELTWELESRRTWHFETSELLWQHDVLAELIANLERLESEVTSPEQGRSVAGRLALARDLKAGFAPGGMYKHVWDEALPAISAAYPGLGLMVQMGLLPLGPDPVSGLWEFAHLTTGEPPERDAEGRLLFDSGSGVVLVLLPGGSFTMGAQSRDRDEKNYDKDAIPRAEPPHEVILSPFFLSKYELTQAQWARITGSTPSAYRRDLVTGEEFTLPHPVETVSWNECMEVCRRVGLQLPTEAQWEYGARAGTSTPWWTGDERDSLARKNGANLADRAAMNIHAPWGDISRLWPGFNDHYAAHAPVNMLAPNSFGLHHVHGNVYELCRDGADDTYYANFVNTPAVDPLADPSDYEGRVNRGGGFDASEKYATSSYRDGVGPDDRFLNTGFRPMRPIE